MTPLKPATITTLFLGFLYVLAVMLKANPEFLLAEGLRIAVLVGTFVVPSVGLIRFKGKKLQWENIAITLLLLLLLADTKAALWQLAGLGLITTACKLYLRGTGNPILNPAAISLAAMSLLGLVTTWWGVSFAPRFTDLGISMAMLFTLPLGLYIIWKYQKVPTLIGTVFGVVVANIAFYDMFPYKLLLEGTFAFFLLIMATEPKTTPVVDDEEWVFGVLLGLSLPLWFKYNLPLPYLLNLLVANVVFETYKEVKLFFLKRRSALA